MIRIPLGTCRQTPSIWTFTIPCSAARSFGNIRAAVAEAESLMVETIRRTARQAVRPDARRAGLCPCPYSPASVLWEKVCDRIAPVQTPPARLRQPPRASARDVLSLLVTVSRVAMEREAAACRAEVMSLRVGVAGCLPIIWPETPDQAHIPEASLEASALEKSIVSHWLSCRWQAFGKLHPGRSGGRCLPNLRDRSAP